jgi:hypothetical protein
MAAKSFWLPTIKHRDKSTDIQTKKLRDFVSEDEAKTR